MDTLYTQYLDRCFNDPQCTQEHHALWDGAWEAISDWWNSDKGSAFGEWSCRFACQDFDSFSYSYKTDNCMCLGEFRVPPMWSWGKL